ncbi:Uncharacterised protein [Mycobacterium tuberculosis]|nr:Uncharacterised protein [Mycobacterium tuberculosis]
MSIPSRSKSKVPMRVAKFSVISGWRATNCGIRGINQRVPKVGRIARFSWSLCCLVIACSEAERIWLNAAAIALA